MRTPFFKLISLMLSLYIFNGVAAQSSLYRKPDVAGIWGAYLRNEGCSCGCSSYFSQELQLENLLIDGVRGFSYSDNPNKPLKSKLTVSFKNDELIITEKKEIGQIIKDLNDKTVCLTTYRLRYIFKGKNEMLAGTYTSKDENTGVICGYGPIKLTRTSKSSFPISTIKRQTDVLPISSITHFNRTSPKTKKKDTLSLKLKSDYKLSNLKIGTIKDKNEVVVKKVDKQPEPQPTLLHARPRNKVELKTYDNAKVSTSLQLSPPAFAPRNDQYLLEKSFDLVKTIKTSAPVFTIDLYDNGQIDGDTISVYHNGQLVISKQRLSSRPISFTLKINESEPVHEFVLVAENLGSIPPNTSLLIVTAGNKRHEISISTTEQKNAKLLVVYTP